MSLSKEKLLTLADLVADVLLENNLDKQGQPLIEHARRVEKRCQNLSTEQRCAALLHDVLEEHLGNAPFILDMIEYLFGEKVVYLVEVMTRPSKFSYKEYIHALSGFSEAIPIKLADLEDNLDPSRGPIPDSLKSRYIEAKSYLESLRSLRNPARPPHHAT